MVKCLCQLSTFVVEPRVSQRSLALSFFSSCSYKFAVSFAASLLCSKQYNPEVAISTYVHVALSTLMILANLGTQHVDYNLFVHICNSTRGGQISKSKHLFIAQLFFLM